MKTIFFLLITATIALGVQDVQDTPQLNLPKAWSLRSKCYDARGNSWNPLVWNVSQTTWFAPSQNVDWGNIGRFASFPKQNVTVREDGFDQGCQVSSVYFPIITQPATFNKRIMWNNQKAYQWNAGLPANPFNSGWKCTLNNWITDSDAQKVLSLAFVCQSWNTNSVITCDVLEFLTQNVFGTECPWVCQGTC